MNLKLTLLALSLLQASAHGAVIFADNFNRADSNNIDATLTGITDNTDNTGSSLAADGVYLHGQIDPNSAHPTYGAPDANAGNGGGTRILGNQYQLKYGTGTVNTYINHNFNNAAILLAGGFSVSVDVTGYAQATGIQHGAAFAIGMTAAEAASTRDAIGGGALNQPHMAGAFTPYTGAVVSDFWLGIRPDATIAWGSGTTTLGTASVAAKTGTLSAFFSVPDFNSGSTIGFEVFYNGNSAGTGNFTWSDTDANYIGLDGRDGTSVTLDNLSIETIPEPTAAALGLLGAVALLRRRR
jgi:hypothetical protein